MLPFHRDKLHVQGNDFTLLLHSLSQLKITRNQWHREKLSQLRDTGDAIFFRVSEQQARPEALQLARQFVQLTTDSVTGWSSSKPWINATDSDGLLAEVHTAAL